MTLALAQALTTANEALAEGQRRGFLPLSVAVLAAAGLAPDTGA